MGTWANEENRSVFLHHRAMIWRKLTSDDWDVDRSTLETDIARSEEGPKETSACGVSLLLNFVAAVKLCVTASLDTLLDSIIALDSPLVGSTVSSVLTLITDILVALPVITRGGNLSGGERRRRNSEGKSQKSDDCLGEHIV